MLSRADGRVAPSRDACFLATGIEDFSGSMRLGTRRSNADGGPSLYHGKGWNGKGVVTCHSFGCSYNMGKGPVEFL